MMLYLFWEIFLILELQQNIKFVEVAPYQIDSKELLENMSHAMLLGSLPPTSICEDMHLGIQKDIKNIKVYSSLPFEVVWEWLESFKDTQDVFNWTHKDLKGVSPKICQHQIILESNGKWINKDKITWT